MINVLSLSVLCLTSAPIQISPSLAIQVASGLATARFRVAGGSIAVTLPTKFMAGDRISGLVICEPEGKTSSERQANAATLEGLVVELADGKATPQKNRLVSMITPAAVLAGLPLLLKDSSGHVIAQTALSGFTPDPVRPVPPSPNPQPPNVQSPPVTGSEPPQFQGSEPYRAQPQVPPTLSGQHVPDPAGPEPYRIQPICRPGQPIVISGPFDGDAANTNVSIGGQSAVVLAESPTGSILQNPSANPGKMSITVHEGSRDQTLTTNNLTVKLTMDQKTLVQGQMSEAKVTLEGLEGMPRQAFPLRLQLTNLTPNTVRLAGGDQLTLKIDFCKSFSTPLQVKAIQPGGFTLQADVESSYNPYPWGYNDDKDHPIDMNGVDTLGDLENYSIRRLMDTLRDLRVRKLDALGSGSTDLSWYDKKIKLVKGALRQHGVTPDHTLADPDDD